MLRIAIIGCGKIADAHAAAILRIAGCEIVAVCDREPLMSQQLANRFPIQGAFSSVSELLRVARPDVVHITTPPDSHFELATLCLEQGCHVYVEKPFTVNAGEAAQLIDLAVRQGLKLTVGHNFQYSHVTQRMRALVREGYLGGAPVHMESYYGYNLGDPSYARALLGDRHHWVRRLPGKLLHNIISHGIARIAEFFPGEHASVTVVGSTSPLLRSIGETQIIDELRVVISDRDRTTAYFTFSSQMRPSINDFRIYGPSNGLVVDQNHEVLLRLRGNKYKSYADIFIPPVQLAKQYLRNLLANVRLFLSNDLHMDAGLKGLVEAFYDSIRNDTPVPLSYREILLTARIMDAIFAQLNASEHSVSAPRNSYSSVAASSLALETDKQSV